MKAPTSLRLNLLKTPFGLRRDRLTLSWITSARQSAYRVASFTAIALIVVVLLTEIGDE